METIVKSIAVLAVFVGIVLIIAVLVAFPIMWLMNYVFAPSLMLAVFGVGKMTFWRALAFSVLTGFLGTCQTSTEKK
jgi:hypothetical protein